MRRAGWVIAATVLVAVAVMGRNSGPVTSSQAIRATRAAAPADVLPSAPFCRAVGDARVDDPSNYEGSDEQLAALDSLEAAATPSIRQSVLILREHYAPDDGVEWLGETLHGPAQVQAAREAITEYVEQNC